MADQGVGAPNGQWLDPDPGHGVGRELERAGGDGPTVRCRQDDPTFPCNECFGE